MSVKCKLLKHKASFLKHRADIRVLTVTFHSLVYQPVQEGATVVTEGGAGVSVDLKLVL